MSVATERVAVDVALGEMPRLLRESEIFCRNVTRREARNFYFGLKLLPEPKRSAMYALYAYMRLVDDIADDDANGRTLAERKMDLDRWQALTHEWIARGPGGEAEGDPGRSLVWPAFARMAHAYQVPTAVFDDMVAGQRQDLEPLDIPTFDALYQYCYRVASVVGVASLYVFGFEGGEETLKLGVARGVAFQLTNILRDLREDASPPRNRCYIPRDELARFGVRAEQIVERQDSPAFRALMQFQCERAEHFYRQSGALEGRVSPEARSTLQTMTHIYHGLLEKMTRRPEVVLRRRVRLSTWSKAMIAWRALLRSRA